MARKREVIPPPHLYCVTTLPSKTNTTANIGVKYFVLLTKLLSIVLKWCAAAQAKLQCSMCPPPFSTTAEDVDAIQKLSQRFIDNSINEWRRRLEAVIKNGDINSSVCFAR